MSDNEQRLHLVDLVKLGLEERGYQYGYATDEVMEEIETLQIYLEDWVEYERERQAELKEEDF